jgi:hypothetical protein
MSEENITDPNGKVYTTEEFQQLLNGNIFRGGGNVELIHIFRIYGWNIPSLNGIVIPQLFARNLGPIRKPDEHNMKYLDEYCKAMQCGSISITHCKVKVLGNVKFPEFVGAIDFSHNKIKNLRGVEFGCCADIILQNNKIKSLDGCVFPEGVVGIYLDHNEIKSLKGAKFPSTLKRFSISSNPLETLDGIPPQFLKQVRDGIEHEKQHPHLHTKHRVYGFNPSYEDYPPIAPPQPSAPQLDPDDFSDLLPHKSEEYYNNIVPAAFAPPPPAPPAPPPAPPAPSRAFGDAPPSSAFGDAPPSSAFGDAFGMSGFYSDNGEAFGRKEFVPNSFGVPAPPSKDFSKFEFGGPFFGGSRRKKNKKRKLTRKQTQKFTRKLKRKTRTLRQRRVKKTRLYKNKK